MRSISHLGGLYDPLGIVSPVTIGFKILFQELCQAKLDCDEPLVESLRDKWNVLLKGLNSEPLKIRRWCLDTPNNKLSILRCIYACLCYLWSNNNCMLVASKTRVAPLKTQTIPRLELLSALRFCLHSFVDDMFCFTDSVLHWIKGSGKLWKPFVQNRVREIREGVDYRLWNHCQGKSNPADLPSRGMTLSELRYSQMSFEFSLVHETTDSLPLV